MSTAEDEIRKKLEEAGVHVDGQWKQSAGRSVKSPLIEKQRALLSQLEKLLEQQISQDQAQVADLHAKVQILKHGGGLR